MVRRNIGPIKAQKPGKKISSNPLPIHSLPLPLPPQLVLSLSAVAFCKSREMEISKANALLVNGIWETK
jgi:hypothetical protein